MEECGVLEIFGRVEDPEALRVVIRSARWDDVSMDWATRATEDELVAAFLDAAEGGDWVRVVADSTRNNRVMFDETRAACRAAGLSYIHSCGTSGTDGYETAAYWTPGQEKEFEVGLVNGIDVAIPLREISEAADRGGDHLLKLVRDYSRKTLQHLDKKLEMSEECRASLATAGLTV